MSVILWELAETPDATREISGDSQTVVYRARTDSPLDGQQVVLDYSECPKVGDVLVIEGTTYPALFCRRIAPGVISRTDGTWFLVRCEYDSKFDAGDVADLQAKSIKPVDRRDKVTFGTTEITIPFFIDAITDDLIVNTVGDPIAGLTKRVKCDTWRIKRNVGSISQFVVAKNLVGTVNASTVIIYGTAYPAKSLLLNDVTLGELAVENEQQFMPLEMSFVSNPLQWGHQQHVLNAGINERVSGNAGTITRRCQLAGKDVDQPVPLDVNGKMIAPATLRANPAQAHYLDFNEFETSAFGVLNLPTSAPI